MAETTKIQWTDHTFNPWIGCAKVAPGCEHCYAEADMDHRRHRVKWGVNGTRSVTSDAYWKQPLKWNRAAACCCRKEQCDYQHEAGCPQRDRPKVFCASLADVFEGRDTMPESAWTDVEGARVRLFDTIDATPNLDWLLLTKRPENILRMWSIPANGRDAGDDLVLRRDNVWLGTSISDQKTADKAIPELLKCRELSPVLFLSAEPLLGPIEFSNVSGRSDAVQQWGKRALNGIDWIIVGGESGPQARPCNPSWVRSIKTQCQAAHVSVFVKQMGSNVVTRNDMIEDVFDSCETGWPDPEVEYDIHGYREDFQGADCRIRLFDKKGGDPSEWPEDLRVREFPKGAT